MTTPSRIVTIERRSAGESAKRAQLIRLGLKELAK